MNKNEYKYNPNILHRSILQSAIQKERNSFWIFSSKIQCWKFFRPPNVLRNKNHMKMAASKLKVKQFKIECFLWIKCKFLFQFKIFRVVTEFCAKSTFHCIAHLVDKRRHFIERSEFFHLPHQIAQCFRTQCFCNLFNRL